MRFFNKRLLKSMEIAQAAIELAIFGAILIFIIGLIVRLGVSSSQSMNLYLKAMRLAMTESYKTAEGVYTGGPGGGKWFASPARNTASVLLITDRLSVASGQKLGTRDRIPYISSGRGTFSKNLFYTVSPGEGNAVPLFDVFVNGQHFPFTIAKMKTRSTAQLLAEASGRRGRGEATFFKAAVNDKNSKDWDPACASCFDLDRDGTIDVPNPVSGLPVRDDFMWQWKPVADAAVKVNDVLDLDGDLKEEMVIEAALPNITYFDNQEGDIDFSQGDLDPGRWQPIGDPPAGDPCGVNPVLLEECVVGTQETGRRTPAARCSKWRCLPKKIGLQDEIQMYSFTDDGTLLRVEEGELFFPAPGQFVRSTNRQDHKDIVERQFRYSNNTGRFCRGGVRRARVFGSVSGDNPVEACDNCFDTTGTLPDDDGVPNILQTCMDTEEKIIFIRSRIQDLRGRRWVTEVE